MAKLKVPAEVDVLIEDAVRWVALLFRSSEAVQAENRFMRERPVRPS
jgi:hypothetical protein